MRKNKILFGGEGELSRPQPPSVCNTYATTKTTNPVFRAFPSLKTLVLVLKEIVISAMAEYMERASEFTREALFIYSDHHRMIEMTESKRSEDEVVSIIADIIGAGKLGMLAFASFLLLHFVHRNARMTEMKRSGIEVLPAFADNVGELTKR